MIPKKGNGIAMLQDRIAELEAINTEYVKRVAELHRREDTWFKHKAELEAEVERLKEECLCSNYYDEIERLRSALEGIKIHADEWCLADSADTLYYPKEIPRRVVIDWVEQALKGGE